ncbi:hypothetical protein [Novacetimonas hansenii]
MGGTLSQNAMLRASPHLAHAPFHAVMAKTFGAISCSLRVD